MRKIRKMLLLIDLDNTWNINFSFDLIIVFVCSLLCNKTKIGIFVNLISITAQMKNSRSRIEILFDLVMIAVNLILVIKYLSYCLWFSFSGENVSDFCTTLIDKPTDGQHPCHEWLKSTTPSGSCRIDEYYVIEAFEMRERRHWQMRQKKPIRSYMLPLGSRETIVEIGMTRNLVFREEKSWRGDEGD